MLAVFTAKSLPELILWPIWQLRRKFAGDFDIMSAAAANQVTVTVGIIHP